MRSTNICIKWKISKLQYYAFIYMLRLLQQVLWFSCESGTWKLTDRHKPITGIAVCMDGGIYEQFRLCFLSSFFFAMNTTSAAIWNFLKIVWILDACSAVRRMTVCFTDWQTSAISKTIDLKSKAAVPSRVQEGQKLAIERKEVSLNKYFSLFLVEILRMFDSDSILLERKGSLIVRWVVRVGGDHILTWYRICIRQSTLRIHN